MIRKCPVCGILFDVLYPDLWRYKRNHKYYCTYSCLKLNDEGVKKMGKITKEQKQKAVDIALDGGNPVEFLKGCGSVAPDQMWTYIKKTLKAKEPEVYAKLLLKAVDKAPTVQVDGPLRIETPEAKKIEVVEMPEKPKKAPLQYDGYTVCCIESKTFGRFYWDSDHNHLDWTTAEGEEVSFTPAGWKMFLEELPKVAAILGVDL